MMRTLIAIAALVASVAAIAQSQVPNVFEDGTPATAAAVNENFQYVLENASGGCSATQQDNSVLIECADGTSGVIAGAGSAIVLPEGEVGEVPDISVIPIGDFYWEDGNGILIADYVQNWVAMGGCDDCFNMTALTADGRRMRFFRDDSDEFLRVVGGNSYSISYAEEDCQGTPIAVEDWSRTGWVAHYNNQYWTASDTQLDGETLIRSYRYPDGYALVSNEYIERECVNVANPAPAWGTLIINYTPPAEWLNAAYPLTLVQKP